MNLFEPYEVSRESLNFEEAAGLLAKLRKQDALAVIKTWTNSWATSQRFQGQKPSFCVFGCQDLPDSLSHYVQCPVLYYLQNSLCSPVSAFPLVRLGLSSPESKNLKMVACTFYAYHYVRRALEPTLAVREIHEFFKDCFLGKLLS